MLSFFPSAADGFALTSCRLPQGYEIGSKQHGPSQAGPPTQWLSKTFQAKNGKSQGRSRAANPVGHLNGQDRLQLNAITSRLFVWQISRSSHASGPVGEPGCAKVGFEAEHFES